MPETFNPISDQKATLRKTLRQCRAAVRDHSEKSRSACRNVMALPEWEDAHTVLTYVSYRSELKTEWLLHALLDASEKRCVVPLCLPDGGLELLEIRSLSELSPGAYGIPEPDETVRHSPERHVRPSEVNLAILPGTGFDPLGHRLGQGGGYYDRLLPKLHPEALTVGLAFDAQLVPEIPTEPHDLRVRCIVTETRTLRLAARFHVLGILGGIACGKSLVSSFFRSHGIPVFDADRFGHSLYERPDFRQTLLHHWGPDVLSQDGTFDRKKIARIVFPPTLDGSPSTELTFLNSLFHPAIHQAWLEFRAEAAQNRHSLAILDAALLLESGWQNECDELLFVETPRERQIEFACSRGWTVQELESREKNQFSLAHKRAAATINLPNSGTPEELNRQLEALLQRLTISSTEPQTRHENG